jgi:hypothetical protein
MSETNFCAASDIIRTLQGQARSLIKYNLHYTQDRS